MSKDSDAKDKEFRRDSYWNKERLKAHAAPHLEFNPEKKPWVGLTDEEATALWEGTDDRDSWELIKQVEKTLKWKNT
jgi:hypothetical protein